MLSKKNELDNLTCGICQYLRCGCHQTVIDIPSIELNGILRDLEKQLGTCSLRLFNTATRFLIRKY